MSIDMGIIQTTRRTEGPYTQNISRVAPQSNTTIKPAYLNKAVVGLSGRIKPKVRRQPCPRASS